MRLANAVVVMVLTLLGHWADTSFPQTPLFVPAPGLPITVGPGSGEVLLADLNRDGHLDLLTKHLLGQNIGVRVGNGKGNFESDAQGSMRLGYQPGAIAIGDINNDTILDLGIAAKEADREFVRVFLGTGKGAFSEVSGSPFEVSASFEFYKPILYLIDINEDQKADIVTANGRRNRIDILFGNGQGDFADQAEIILESGGDFYTFAVADIDQDRHLDIVAASGVEMDSVRSRLHIKRGDGRGTFVDASGSIPPVLPNPRIGALADVNGDTYADVVVTHGRSRRIEVLLNRGGGTFAPAPTAAYTVAGEANQIVVTDVNGDGWSDFVAATVSSITVLLGDSGGFKPAPGSPFRAGPGAYKVTVGDVNGDRKPDLVASSFEGDAVTVLLGR